jgi:hypothetical protein
MTTTTNFSPAHYLGRCPAKGCRHVVRVEVARTASTPDRFGNVRGIVTTASLTAAVNTHNHACPDHGLRTRTWKPVKGTYSAERECDSRCTGAIGPDCECQCGGANHGAAHGG